MKKSRTVRPTAGDESVLVPVAVGCLCRSLLIRRAVTLGR